MNCTVVITTFFSGEKLEKCINNIDSKFNILVIDNGCEEKKNFILRINLKTLII